MEFQSPVPATVGGQRRWGITRRPGRGWEGVSVSRVGPSLLGPPGRKSCAQSPVAPEGGKVRKPLDLS